MDRPMVRTTCSNGSNEAGSPVCPPVLLIAEPQLPLAPALPWELNQPPA